MADDTEQKQVDSCLGTLNEIELALEVGDYDIAATLGVWLRFDLERLASSTATPVKT